MHYPVGKLERTILNQFDRGGEGVRLNPARAPPDVERIVELFPGDPFPDYSMDTVMDYDICANA